MWQCGFSESNIRFRFGYNSLYMRALLIISCFCVGLRCFAQIPVKVVEVRDGDSFHGLWNGKKYLCRLTHIDAPELKQNFGMAARDSVRKLMLGKAVIVDSLGTDLYKRVLVSVKVDGMRLDSLMIRKGWAWHYAAYSKNHMLADCMKHAISENKGLWSCGIWEVCPPWLYRKYNYQNKLRSCNGCN